MPLERDPSAERRASSFSMEQERYPEAWLLQVAEGRRRRDLRLQDGTVTVGRAADCEVVLDSTAIAPRHATLRLEGGRAMVAAAAPAARFAINGVTVREGSVWAGDEIRIGDALLRLQQLPQPASQPAADEPPRDSLESEIDAAALHGGLPVAALLELYDWSRSGPAERSGEMLANLGGAGGAGAAALLLCGVETRPTVLAAWGTAVDELVEWAVRQLPGADEHTGEIG